MKRSGIATLRLHPGIAPSWLTRRMKKLANEIFRILLDEYGTTEILKRISDPIWFQALSNVLAYDWDSSGVTTVLCGVLKSTLKNEHGILVAGGKGKTSRKTPADLQEIGTTFHLSESEIERLIRTSRIVAKVDNAVIQDGYHLYHHSMFISEQGEWTIVQQGMNDQKGCSRRYHWHSESIRDFIEDHPEEIIGEAREKSVLNMASDKSSQNRNTCLDLVKDNPRKIENYFNSITPYSQISLIHYFEGTVARPPRKIIHYKLLPRRMNWNALKEVYEFQPTNYEEMIAVRGIGPATIRGLALIAELIFGERPDWKDPVKYSYNLGGKDGVPFPVPRGRYDRTIEILREAVNEARLGDRERLTAIKRLKKFAKKIQYVN
ncbi:MAG: DUF763 domain-containing protein [Candidatus Helarchaeota archaeon]